MRSIVTNQDRSKNVAQLASTLIWRAAKLRNVLVTFIGHRAHRENPANLWLIIDDQEMQRFVDSHESSSDEWLGRSHTLRN